MNIRALHFKSISILFPLLLIGLVFSSASASESTTDVQFSEKIQQVLEEIQAQNPDLSEIEGWTRTFEAASNLLGAHHLSLAPLASEIALHHEKQTRHAESRTWRAIQVEVLSRHVAEDNCDLLDARRRLAGSLRRLGELQDSLDTLNKVVPHQEVRLGTDHPTTLKTLHLKALLLDELGKWSEAEQLHEKVLNKRARVLGKEDPDTLKSKSGLATTKKNLGDFDAAQKLEEEVLESRQKVLGVDHPHTLSAKSNFANTLLELGKNQLALQLYTEVLDTTSRVHGEDHSETIKSKGRLARLLSKMGRLKEAARLEEEVLAFRSENLGDEHTATARAKVNLAVTLKALGNRDRALRLQQESARTLQKNLGAEHPHTLLVRGNIANAFREQGNFEEAKVVSENIVSILTRAYGENHPDVIWEKRNLAATYHALGDLHGARRLEEEVLAAFRELLGDTHPETAKTQANLAMTLSSLGFLAEAYSQFQPAAEILIRALGDEHSVVLGAKHGLANLLGKMGRLSEALELQEAVVATLNEKLGENHEKTVGAKDGLASILLQLGEISAARNMFEQLLASAKETISNESSLVQRIESNYAATLSLDGDYSAAIELLRKLQASEQARLGANHPKTLTTKGNLAATLDNAGMIDKSLEMTMEVWLAREDTLGKEHPDTLRSQRAYADLLSQMGSLAKARESYEEVLSSQIHILGEENPETLATKRKLGQALRAIGDLSGARDILEEALLGASSRLGEHHSEVYAIKGSLAAVLNRAGNKSASAKIYRDLLRFRIKKHGADHPFSLMAKSNLAFTLTELGEFQEAMAHVTEVVTARTRVLGLHHPETQRSQINQAEILMMQGQQDAALAILKQVRTRRSIPESPSLEPSHIDVDLYRFIALLYRTQAKDQEAARAFEKAMNAVESLAARIDPAEEWRTKYHASEGQTFFEAQDFEEEHGRNDRAFEISERYRAHSLLTYTIGRFTADPGASIEDAELRSIAAQYDATGRRLERLRADRDVDLFQKVVAEHSTLRRKRDIAYGQAALRKRTKIGKIRPTSVAELQNQLASETALLSFRVGDDRTHLQVVTRSHFESYQIDVGRAVLAAQVERAVDLIRDEERESSPENHQAIRRVMAWLHDKLMSPALSSPPVSSAERFLILPDGPLHSLPFSALSSVSIGSAQRWLSEQKSIHLAHSATSYAQLVRSREGKNDAGSSDRIWVGLGSPLYPNSGADRAQIVPGFGRLLRSLPQAKREILAIQQRFMSRDSAAGSGSHSEIWLGEQATEDQFWNVAHKASHLHIAAHGITIRDAPEAGHHPSDSFIAFSLFTEEERKKRGLKQNGLLQAWEIANHLKLDAAELVVLSACDTAVGENRGGEGLMSLARAFLQAGARSVLASLWKVDDLSTSELMIRFYRYLLDGESKVDALRLAQMELASGPIEAEIDGKTVEVDFTAPYYWAGFQLIGDWK